MKFILFGERITMKGVYVTDYSVETQSWDTAEKTVCCQEERCLVRDGGGYT